MVEIEKIVVITQKTWLDGLVEKYNTKEQAKFYIEHLGGEFSEYVAQHTAYYTSLAKIKQAFPRTLRYQIVDKSFLPSFLFSPTDLVIVLGRDGLVINTAKYLNEQAIMGINPDPERIEGVLLPFTVKTAAEYIKKILKGETNTTSITVAQADLNTNQSLIGVNDIFVGQQTHQSARYIVHYNGWSEQHSSSGIIISTGIGSTGWFKSVISGAMGISQAFLPDVNMPDLEEKYRQPWDANYLHFCVREPWGSRITGNRLVFGKIGIGEKLVFESLMPEGGVIFSDGIEKDRVQFNSGAVADIFVSRKKVQIYIN